LSLLFSNRDKVKTLVPFPIAIGTRLAVFGTGGYYGFKGMQKLLCLAMHAADKEGGEIIQQGCEKQWAMEQ
jgi:hypothetical protein